MNKALDHGIQYVNVPEEQHQEQNHFRNCDTMDIEKDEERIHERVNTRWEKVHEAID